MKRVRVGALAVVAFATLFALPVTAFAASCPAPDLAVTPASAPAGSTVTIEGRHFSSGCSDAISCPNTGPCPSPTPDPPSRGIGISFKQDGETWPLTRVDAGANYGFTVDVKIPEDAQPGPAKFVASGGWSVRFTVGLPRTGAAEIYRTTRIMLIALSAALATLTLGALLRTRAR